MDSRAFFLVVESIIEVRRNPIFFKKFLLGEDYSCKWTSNFLASGKHSFSVFQIFLPVIIACDFLDIPFRLAEKYFSIKSFSPASGNGFSG